MTDVEKYGLVALVCVAGVLGLILVQDAFQGDPADAADAVAAVQPVVIRSATEVTDPRPRVLRPAPDPPAAPTPGAHPARRANGGETPRPAARYTVRPLTAGRGSFEWEEPPVVYPGPRSSAPRATHPAGTEVHVVQKNETLSDIALKHYGTSTRWRDLLALNPGLDPLKLQPGQEVVVRAAGGVPATPAAATAPVRRGPPRAYTVRKGDTLSEIAQREMGSATRSQELFQANRDKLKSADQLKPGMVLTIP